MKLKLYLLLIPFLVACVMSSAQLSAPLTTPSKEIPKIQPQISTQTSIPTIRTVTASVLTVRTCPRDDDQGCPPVAWLKQGQQVTVTYQLRDWCKIDTGWIECKDWTK